MSSYNVGFQGVTNLVDLGFIVTERNRKIASILLSKNKLEFLDS